MAPRGGRADRSEGVSGPCQASLLALVWLYQHSLGKLIGGNCRFSPSCSTFAATALRRHGASGGLWLIVRRLMRCHPWYTGSPIDPVPEKFHGVEIAG